MSLVLSGLLWLVTLAILVPLLVFSVECLLALLPPRRMDWTALPPCPRLAVLIPAHDEAPGIAATLLSVGLQLRPLDRLVVVADNCQDETAAVARAHGAEVVERHNRARLGKGYALDYGVRTLASDPPDVVVMLDADCEVAPDTLDRLARLAYAEGRPIQAAYLLAPPARPNPAALVSLLAFTVKNLVRPLGLDRLGLPCLLTGSGMAFPWAILRVAPLASGKSAEDMRLAVDLAVAGSPPRFCSAARVTSRLPARASAARAQRARWEHGHLETALVQAPRLISGAWRQRRLDLLALGLELAVPPLSLLIIGWGAGWCVGLLAAWLGLSPLPWLLLSLGGGLLIVATLAAWARFARREIPARAWLALPSYVLGKLPLYLQFLVRRQTESIRTDRDT